MMKIVQPFYHFVEDIRSSEEVFNYGPKKAVIFWRVKIEKNKAITKWSSMKRFNAKTFSLYMAHYGGGGGIEDSLPPRSNVPWCNGIRELEITYPTMYVRGVWPSRFWPALPGRAIIQAGRRGGSGSYLMMQRDRYASRMNRMTWNIRVFPILVLKLGEFI